MSDCGKTLRLNRILKGPEHKALVVAFDHGGILGPIPGTLDPEAQLRTFIEAGVDAVLVNPGLVRFCRRTWDDGHVTSILVRLDWTNTLSGGVPPRSALLTRPEEALRMGADGVMTFLLLGTGDAGFEACEIQRTAEVARECERLGVPLFVEALNRAPGIRPGDPDSVLLPARIAVELGADAIKTEYTGDPASMAEVVQACPAPLLVLGGQRLSSEAETCALVRDIVISGAAGIVFGRNVFQAEDVAGLLRALRLQLDAARCESIANQV